ncbi:hypothetical protein MLD52_12245 [Puniceicoccaceae bacterium K14]|nr:hypothetical protein [Puniceicoccaceae bacterium K14]
MIDGFPTSPNSVPTGQSYGASNNRGNAITAPEPSEKPKEAKDPNELTDAEKEQVRKLEARDAEVRAHEQAHLAAAGSLARGGPTYVYQTGPDGKNYAIGGSVKIDTSPGKTPEETKEKAAQIRASALAPGDPSSQDIKVAAAASTMALNAESEATEEEPDPFAQPALSKNPFDSIVSAYKKSGNSPADSIYNFEA